MFVRACVQEKERETIGTDKTFTISPLDPALVSLSLVHRDRNGKEKTGVVQREGERNRKNWFISDNEQGQLNCATE